MLKQMKPNHKTATIIRILLLLLLSCHIRHDILPAEVVALGVIVVHLLGYCHNHRHDGADDRKDEAHTEVQCLVLTCPKSRYICSLSVPPVAELCVPKIIFYGYFMYASLDPILLCA